MAGVWNRIKGRRSHEYAALPFSEKEPASPSKHRTGKHSAVFHYTLAICAFFGIFGLYEFAR
jgi:hypothetical protein